MLFQGLIQRNVICFFFLFPITLSVFCMLCLSQFCIISEMKNIKFFTTNLITRREERERETKNQCCRPIHLLIFSDSLFVPQCGEAASDLQMNCLLMCVLHFVVKNFLRGNSSQNSTSTKYSVGSVSITQSMTIGEHNRHKV